jgi:2,3-bisphosphoglycerate-dependent phosphoglycerate mutase
MYKIVFMRHGESTWNLENRFTGWTDVDLTEKCFNEAKTAGRMLFFAGFNIDLAFNSVL